MTALTDLGQMKNPYETQTDKQKKSKPLCQTKIQNQTIASQKSR
jgi:hypothetical protein